MEELRKRLEALKADPPRLNESPARMGEKLLELADLNMRLAERLLDKPQGFLR